MKTILVDTNFLLIPGQFGVDIFSEIARIADFPHRLAVAAGTLDELEKLGRGRSRDAAAARLGLQLLKKQNIRVLRPRKVFKGVDDFLVESSKKGDILVATMDRVLQKRLRLEGVKLVIMRSKKHLTISE